MMDLFSMPELLLAALILAVVLLEAFFASLGSRVTVSMGYASLFGTLAILAVALSSWPERLAAEAGRSFAVVFSSYCTVLILSFACLTILLSLSRRRGARTGPAAALRQPRTDLPVPAGAHHLRAVEPHRRGGRAPTDTDECRRQRVLPSRALPGLRGGRYHRPA